ncbi:MAG: gamma-glutamylcyclotransferase family protein, partial [Acidobacteriota bacterium]
QGQADELVRFEQSSITLDDPQVVALSGKTQHVIVKFNGRGASRVVGTVFEITDEELLRADQYECAPYERVAAMLASGKQAWVYADARLQPDTSLFKTGESDGHSA